MVAYMYNYHAMSSNPESVTHPSNANPPLLHLVDTYNSTVFLSLRSGHPEPDAFFGSSSPLISPTFGSSDFWSEVKLSC